MSNINTLYLVSNPRFSSFSNETRLTLSNEDLTQYIQSVQSSIPAKYPFVTELFFMTSYSLHIGIIRTIAMYGEFLGQLSRIQQKRKEMTNNKPQWQNVSPSE